MREPDFNQFEKVLRRQKPDRPVLFEIFMNMPLYERVNGRKLPADDEMSVSRFTAEAFARLGYDYVTIHASNFGFPTQQHERQKTISLNQGFVITDERSFDQYKWPNPEDFDDSKLTKIGPYLPGGMKLMVMGPGGVLENAISLMGYDNMCYLLHDEPELVGRVFDHIGERLVRYYEMAVRHEPVGLICSNDDWGFNTQTFLSPADMRRYVFPWHKRIVDLSHAAGKLVMLHSCGNFREVIDDTIAMGFDAKHSYEDVIMPVEQAYEAWHDRIAILGGIDVDFICTHSVEDVAARARALLERTADRGGYALGTGNSVPEYIPHEKYFAMVHEASGYVG